MWQDLFESGRLLLPESPSPALPPVESGLPLSAKILILLSVLLFLLQLRRFFDLAPFLWNSIFRARGGAAREGLSILVSGVVCADGVALLDGPVRDEGVGAVALK